MEFKQGTHVYTSDGKNVGSIDRVVLDPSTDEVTDLIVRKGWFSEDKVVPLGLVETTAEDRVTLDKTENDLPPLLKFEETYYAPAYDNQPQGGDSAYPQGYTVAPMYSYPPLGVAWWGWGYGGNMGYGPDMAEPDYMKRVQDNIPTGTVAVKEGARVLSLEGDHIGNVDEIFTDTATNRVAHLIISQGLLFKERKLIPTNWIKLAGEDDVMLTVKTKVVDNLPEYKGDQSS